MREFLIHAPAVTAEHLLQEKPGRAVQWMAELQTDGSWKDIDYVSQQRGGWPAVAHLERTMDLARAFVSSGIHSNGSEALLTAALRSLDYWLAKDFRSPNWWHNEIGVPRAVAGIMLILNGRLSPHEFAKGIEVVCRAGISRTGQNKVWLAGIVLTRAALQNDAALARQASDAIFAEVAVGTGEGIQPDYSFHQHGPAAIRQLRPGVRLRHHSVGFCFAGNRVCAASSKAGDIKRLPVERRGADPAQWGHGHKRVRAAVVRRGTGGQG